MTIIETDKVTAWNTPRKFPSSDGDDWSFFRPPRKRKVRGYEKVLREAKRWHPYDPLLVSTPASNRYVPPVCLHEFAKKLQRKTVIQYRVLTYLFSVSALLLFTMHAFYGKTDKALISGIASLTLAIYVFLENNLIHRHLPRLQERALFITYIYRNAGKQHFICWSLMLAAGAAQWIMLSSLSMEDLIRRYGVMNDAPLLQEVWRYFVGGFIHSGIPHWAANFVLLTVAVGIASIFTRLSWLVFLVITSLSFVIFILVPYPGKPDAIIGVSGGIYGLLGFSLALSILLRRHLPQLLWLALLNYSLICIGLTHVMYDVASTFIHVVGFAVGLLLAGVSALLNESASQGAVEAS
jgi:membrane associated rhomboid family serine protease